ncbi:T9SS type A sorting domain-containing protein [Flavobacterium sp.]|uniref:T9SS type A sorting domain-containing protein n=1 Tax=Flavobacterium sp. TaxID=239 RepID=UPI00262B3F12|nr:T9SS type A sorting domain-containing protein [Flavobacterium sp.]
MKKSLLFLFFFTLSISYSQIPAPAGCRTFDKLDTNNDGFTSFEIDIYLNYVRSYALSEFGYNLNGYNLTLYPSQTDHNNNTNPILSSNYINVVANQQYCYLKATYSGSGTSYNQADLDYNLTCHILVVHQPTSNYDNDGVANGLEDLNTNLRLGDDDTDADGIPNFKDTDDDNDGVLTINEDYNTNGNPVDDDTNSNGIPDFLDNTNTLQIIENNFSIFYLQPNPVNEILNISYTENLNQTVTIIDVNGRILKKYNNSPSIIDVSNFENGIYIIQIQSNGKSSYQKFVKN